MTVFRPSQVSGFQVPLKTTHTRHLNRTNNNSGMIGSSNNKVEGDSFATLLRNAFYDVNSIELRKDNMMQQFIINPDSINVHDLTNAMAKSELSLGFVRAVSNKIVSAYRDISNLR